MAEALIEPRGLSVIWWGVLVWLEDMSHSGIDFEEKMFFQGVLKSLPLLDQLRSSNTTKWTRAEGSNLDVLNGTDSEKRLAICHLDATLLFTLAGRAFPLGVEGAFAVALALHHLNVGDGSIVPQLEGLNQRCDIRFTVEFFDSEASQRVALSHIIEATNRQPGIERLPCGFIGPSVSMIAVSISTVTGILGFPTIAASATSPVLDDKNQFPLFARTIPSDLGTAVPIIQFLSQELGIGHLAVINVNNSFGNAFVDALRLAARLHAPAMVIHQTALDETTPEKGDGDGAIVRAISSVKKTRYRYVFGVLASNIYDSVMEEAYSQEIAGTGVHNWFFADSFTRVLSGREFEQDSPLHLSYQGVGLIAASGGFQGMPDYDKFVKKMAELGNTEDMDYVRSIVNSDNPVVKDMFDEVQDLFTPISRFGTFLYEAAIAMGLSACQVAGRANGNEENNLFLNGQDHFDQIIKMQFKGVTEDVRFGNEGSRMPTSALFKVTNFVAQQTNGTARFDESVTHLYEGGTWQHIHHYTFNDGTTTIPNDIPEAPMIDHVFSTGVRVVVLLLCATTYALAIGLAIWTHRHRKARVILSSQPFFLHTICLGTVILASSIIPLSIDHGVASLNGCTIACTAIPWLLSLGFTITFCALFTKTNRVNMILNHPNKFRRITVSVWDVAKPMDFLLTLNTIILSVMSALSPLVYEIITVRNDEFGQPAEIRGRCNPAGSVGYLIALGAIGIGVLAYTSIQSYGARNLSTEYQESRHIFRALVAIILVLFVGGPVLALSNDNSEVFLFVLSAIIFVTACSVLLLIFIPKMQLLKEFNLGEKPRVHISTFEESYRSGDSGHIGEKILSTKTPLEMLEEIDALKRLLFDERNDRENSSKGTLQPASETCDESDQVFSC